MKVTPFLHCLCISMFVVACNRQESSSEQTSQKQNIQPIGLTINPLRKELGLRPIDDDWILYRTEGNQEDWKIRKDGFPAKSIFEDESKNITSEEDYYYSGAQFTDIEGHDWEHITVNYNYETKRIVVAYAGTNKTTEAVLSKFFMTVNGSSTNITAATAAVKEVVDGWPKQ